MMHRISGKTLRLESLADEGHGLFVIFDHQHAHGHIQRHAERIWKGEHLTAILPAQNDASLTLNITVW